MAEVEYIAGGATQNSIRVAQWMLQVRQNHTALHTLVRLTSSLHEP